MSLILSNSTGKIGSNALEPIIDSKMTFAEAIAGTDAPKEIIDSLCILDVHYYSFDGKLHQGQIVVNKILKDDIIHIFNLIEKTKFPVGKVIPIVKYQWNDDSSMGDNNTSSFNYRFVAGTKRISLHSLGRAVDINPRLNPVIYEDGHISPKGAKRNINAPGTFTPEKDIVKEFEKLGWKWGGTYVSFKDFHHFEKR
jgi:hypothetical protein